MLGYLIYFFFLELLIQEEFIIQFCQILLYLAMNLRHTNSDCSYFIQKLLKKVQTQTVNRSIHKYVQENMPNKSLEFFNNTQNQVANNYNFKPIKGKETQEKEPSLRHVFHAIKFVSSEPNTKRTSSRRNSNFNQFELKRGVDKIKKGYVYHKKYASTLPQHDNSKKNLNSPSKLIPLFSQNSCVTQNQTKQIKSRFSQAAMTEQYIESLRLKKKKIEEAFSSFIDPKTTEENNRQSQAIKKSISHKKLLNLQIITNYDGEIIPLKKSSRRNFQKQKLLQIPNYRIKTQANSNYQKLPVTIKTHKPFQTFKNVSSSIISSNVSTGHEVLKNSSKMVSILDLKSQKQNVSAIISPKNGSKNFQNQKNNAKIFNFQDMLPCTRSRRMIELSKRNKKQDKVQAAKFDQYPDEEQY